jgi:two-component system phosphate regulon response regulator PhoB
MGASLTCPFWSGERCLVKEDRRKPIRGPSAPRIVVVEDDPDIASLLVYNLRSEGYFAESTHRGDDAEKMLAESPPNLVILDWMLPGVTGVEICARLRTADAR